MNNNDLQETLAHHRAVDPHSYNMMTQLLEAEVEYRERRSLFIRLMRKPEMALVREALHQLKWDEDVDWCAMPEIELFRYGYRNDCCMVLCGAYMLVCLDVNADTPYFTFLWLHDEQNASCRCEFCVMDRRLSA